MTQTIGNAIPPASVAPPPVGDRVVYGLFDAARIIENPPPHELNGVQYEPVCLTHVDEWPVFCHYYRYGQVAGHVEERMPYPKGKDTGPSHAYERKLFRRSKSLAAAAPFALYAGEECYLGNHDQTIALGNLKQRFLLGEQAAVERVVYHGLMGVFPALRYKPLILTGGGVTGGKPLPLVDGIALLEHWLASDSGACGVIHCPRFLATILPAQSIHLDQGNDARTVLRNQYVFGTGYSGDAPYGDTGPVHEEKDRVWLYASRPVTIRRSSLIIPADYQTGAFSKARNEASLLVERLYVVDWPCHVAAVQVDAPRYRLEAKPTDAHEQLPQQTPVNQQKGGK